MTNRKSIFHWDFSCLANVREHDIGARTFFNGSVTYALPGSMSNWKLFLNVNNILNTSPPVDPLNLYIPQATSTGASIYDLTGRDVSVGFRVAF